MLDEVVNAGYPYYYLFDDVDDDAGGGMNKDGENFRSNRIARAAFSVIQLTL